MPPTGIVDPMLAEIGCIETVDSVALIMWLSNTRRYSFWFNKSRAAFTGKDFQHDFSEDWIDSIHPNDRDGYLVFYKRCFDQRIKFRYLYRLLRHDNRYCWMFDVGGPRYNNNIFQGYLGFSDEVEYFDDVEKKNVQPQTGFFVATNKSSLLTKKETEVLIYLSKGMSGPEISNFLSISLHTVIHHKKSIFNKLGANNTIKAVNIARILQII